MEVRLTQGESIPIDKRPNARADGLREHTAQKDVDDVRLPVINQLWPNEAPVEVEIPCIPSCERSNDPARTYLFHYPSCERSNDGRALRAVRVRVRGENVGRNNRA